MWAYIYGHAWIYDIMGIYGPYMVQTRCSLLFFHRCARQPARIPTRASMRRLRMHARFCFLSSMCATSARRPARPAFPSRASMNKMMAKKPEKKSSEKIVAGPIVAASYYEVGIKGSQGQPGVILRYPWALHFVEVNVEPVNKTNYKP